MFTSMLTFAFRCTIKRTTFCPAVRTLTSWVSLCQNWRPTWWLFIHPWEWVCTSLVLNNYKSILLIRCGICYFWKIPQYASEPKILEYLHSEMKLQIMIACCQSRTSCYLTPKYRVYNLPIYSTNGHGHSTADRNIFKPMVVKNLAPLTTP